VGLARWLLGERIDAAVGLRVVMALAGAALVVGGGSAGDAQGASAASPLLPDLLAVLGGMMFALINVMLRREAGRDSAERALAMFLGGALVPSGVCLALFALNGPGAALFAFPSLQLAWLLPVLALGLLFFAGNLALQYGAGRLPAQVTAVVMPMEVVFAGASAVAWGGETLSVPLLLGAALILGASLLAAWPTQSTSASAPAH
jgi:drug/metabolite transporter (DMT)-like permease